jgi:hypothetical protein
VEARLGFKFRCQLTLLILYPLVSAHHITSHLSHHITSITSHHITSITSHRITSHHPSHIHHITSITSHHHITSTSSHLSHHVASHHITSHHVGDDDEEGDADYRQTFWLSFRRLSHHRSLSSLGSLGFLAHSLALHLLRSSLSSHHHIASHHIAIIASSHCQSTYVLGDNKL